MIVVTGADLTSLNSTAASATVATGSSDLTLTGISSASGTFSAVLNGADTEITLVAPSASGGSSGGSDSGTVVVSDTASNDTGGARTIVNTGTSPGSAAIVQNIGNNGNVVTATLPASVSITSDGPSTAQSGTDAVNTLFGGQDTDLMIGGLGNDTLRGGAGADTISTGDGADLVVIGTGGGADVVTDFDGAAGDRIQIAANANGTTIDTYVELVVAASNTAAGVQIALGSGNTLTLNGVAVSELQSGWFTFSWTPAGDVPVGLPSAVPRRLASSSAPPDQRSNGPFTAHSNCSN